MGVVSDSRSTIDEAIGANIRQLRLASGLSQEDLAAHLTALGTEWTASNVSLIESGKRKVTLTALSDMCRVFRVNALAFFGSQGTTGLIAERLSAMGGSDESTRSASPSVADSEEAAAIARRRVGARVLDRIVRQVYWADAISIESRKELALDVIEELYESRDVYCVREEIASSHALEMTGSRTLHTVTGDDLADARAWATRRLIGRVTENLEPQYLESPPF